MANEIGVTEVSATSMEIISALVQETLKQKAMLLPTVSNYSQYAVKGSNIVSIPRRTQFAAADKTENTDLTAQVLTFAVDQIALNKNKAIYAALERIAELQATPDVEANIIQEMAAELALQVDKDIYAQLLLASAAAPDHRIAFAGGTGTFAQTDILEAARLLKVQSVPVPSDTWMILHPTEEKKMLLISDFVRADSYGNNPTALESGLLGTLYGIKVLVSNVATEDRVVVWHKSAVGFASMMQPEYRTDYKLISTSKEFLLQMIYGVSVLDSGKRQVLLGSAT